MFFYTLYLAGYFGCILFPRRFCYWVACRLADVYSWRAVQDREAVRRNLMAVLETNQVSQEQVRSVFRYFAMYLVDFFRFTHLTPENVQRLVRVEGLDNMKQALQRGRGVIGLTAHLGNYELAGAVLALLGLPVYALVFTHQNPYVNSFFSRQRARVGVQGIPVQRKNQRNLLEASLSALGQNGVLGLVGDRDFFEHGLELPMFGRPVKIPRGPAAFSLRTGAPIVPAFLVREPDGSYRFVAESPIHAPQGVPREEAIRQLTQSCVEVMARYIRKYPTQWYMFQEFWRPGPAVIR